MEINKIRELALANGFSLKEQASGNMDLHSYVYEFANALLKEATPEGFVLISKKLSDDLNDHLWDFMTDNFISTNEDGDSYIACDDFDLRKFYSEIIEAQEQSHD